MNIKDSYIHGADGKGVVKSLYFATGVESVLKADGSASYNTAAAKDLVFLLADINGTKIGLPIPTLNQNTTGYASKVLTQSRATNASHYLVFVDSNNSSATAESLYTDAGISYNPSTDTLALTKVTVSAAAGFNYTGIENATTDVARNIWFANASGRGIPCYNDNFTFNPANNGTLYVNNISGTNIKITIGNTAVNLGETYTPDTSISSSSTHNTIPSSLAVYNAILNGMAANDAMVFKGIINGGASAAETVYTPAADRGWTYKVGTAGYINGVYHNTNDTFICLEDSTAAATSSNVSTIRTKWGIVEGNGDYLSIHGGTMDGTSPINFTHDKIALNFRHDSSAYYSKVQYMTAGNEALVFSNTNAVTSFIFKCGYNLANGSNWNSVFNTTTNVPSIQIKKQSLYVNSFIASGTDPAYNFLVGGTSYLGGNTTLNGTLTWATTPAALTSPLYILVMDGTTNGVTKYTTLANLRTSLNITDKTGIKLGTVSGTLKTDGTVIINNSSTGLTIQGGTNAFKIGDGTNYISVAVAHGLTTKNLTANGTNYAIYTTASSLPNLDNIYTRHALAIPYIVGNSSDSVGTWTGSYSGLSYVDGLTIIYVPKVAGGANTTLNINNLGEIPCYLTNDLRLGNHFAIDTPIMFTYIEGKWRRADFWQDINTWRPILIQGDTFLSAAPAYHLNFIASGPLAITGSDHPTEQYIKNITFTLIANALNKTGYVAAPSSSTKNQVWMTDNNGNPTWRAVTVPSTVPTIGTSDTTLVTIGGITVKAKIGSYAASNHTHYYLTTNGDHRSDATTPNDYANKFTFVGLKSNSTLGISNAGTYSYLIGLRGWGDHSGGGSHELAFSQSLGLFRRMATDASTWGDWIRIADSSNIVNNNISVTWNSETTIATIAGVPIKIKIPNNPNVDTKVTLNKDTADANYRILFKYTANDTNETTTVKYASTLFYNPSTKLFRNDGGGQFSGDVVMATENAFVGYEPRKIADGGGWSYEPFRMRGYDNIVFARLGVYGSGNDLSYIFIGTNIYNSTANLRISPTGYTTAVGYIKVDSSDNYVLLGAGGHKKWNASSEASTIVARDANLYIFATYFNSNISDQNDLTIGSVYVRNNSDNYIRRMALSTFRTKLDGRWVLKIGDSMSGRLSITLDLATSLDKTSPVLQLLVVNGPSKPSDGWTAEQLANMKLYPGIGFHMPSVTYASIIFTGEFRFINSSYNGYVNTRAAKFITNGGTSAQFVKGDGSLDSNTYALSSALSNYLPLIGGTMTGAIKRYYNTASDDPMIALTSNNLDTWLWRINHGTAVSTATSAVSGFGLKYLGTGSGVNNSLVLYADNLNGTQVAAVTINQSGLITLANGNIVNDNITVPLNTEKTIATICGIPIKLKVTGIDNITAVVSSSASGTSQITAAQSNPYYNLVVGTSVARSIRFLAGSNISISAATNGQITFTNTGVRSVTINGNYLKVNTNGTDANLTIPYATATSVLNSSQISTDTDITQSGVRAYTGIGSSWTGSITSMAYAAMLTFGSPSRGWQMWAGRTSANDGGGMSWRRGNSDATAWEDPRLFFDSGNSSVSGGGSTWGSSLTVKLGTTTCTLTIPSLSSLVTLLYTGTLSLSVSAWTTVAAVNTYDAGTYVLQIHSGNMYASGVFSLCKNTDAINDEIPLHVANTSNGWRPYAKINGNNLLMSSNEATGSSRSYTIKIFKLI